MFRLLRITIMSAVPLLIVSGCNTERGDPRAEIDRMDYGEEQAARTPAERAALIDRLKMIRLGDTLDHVVETVGKPTRRMTVAPKERPTPEHKVLEYSFSAYTPRDPGRSGEAVSLWFDEADKLVKISSNVDGVQSYSGEPLHTNH